MAGQKGAAADMTRCLGPLHVREFYFRGSGKPGDRFCPKCREAVKSIREVPIFSIVTG